MDDRGDIDGALFRGKVDVDAPVAELFLDDGARWYSNGLRELAAELLERADLIDRFTD